MFIKQTCTACPSQWEGEVDGEFVYIRYRWSCLTISFGSSVYDAVGNDPTVSVIVGEDDFDGFITWDEVEPYFETARAKRREEKSPK